MILTHLQKMTKNGEDWGKLIVTKGFKKLPKVQNIAQSGHTVLEEAIILFSSTLSSDRHSFIRILAWVTRRCPG